MGRRRAVIGFRQARKDSRVIDMYRICHRGYSRGVLFVLFVILYVWCYEVPMVG